MADLPKAWLEDSHLSATFHHTLKWHADQVVDASERFVSMKEFDRVVKHFNDYSILFVEWHRRNLQDRHKAAPK